MKDSLGDRIKANYEDRTRYFLPRRTYTIIRLDGKAFHTFTKDFERPFDKELTSAMNNTAMHLCKNVQGCKLAYIQSDEISLVLTDFDDIRTDAWFDGNIQKITSISASMATASFNSNQLSDKFAYFDSRVFTIPEKTEVKNYLIWRQEDATRNSIQMVAQSLYSPKQLHGKKIPDLHEMIFQKGLNWNDYDIGFKRGRVIVKEQRPFHGELNPRFDWVYKETPIFTSEDGQKFLNLFIP